MFEWKMVYANDDKGYPLFNTSIADFRMYVMNAEDIKVMLPFDPIAQVPQAGTWYQSVCKEAFVDARKVSCRFYVGSGSNDNDNMYAGVIDTNGHIIMDSRIRPDPWALNPPAGTKSTAPMKWYVRNIPKCEGLVPRGKISVFDGVCPPGWTRRPFLKATGVECGEGQNCGLVVCRKD